MLLSDRRDGDEADLDATVAGTPLELLASRAPAQRRALAELVAAARTDLPVWISGPTGSGKEAAARGLHAVSGRAGGPCLAVNCATLAGDTARSALFGHVRGAFTGAERDRPGLMAEAAGGTLILDEAHRMSPAIQGMFLRLLTSADRGYLPVGSTRSVQCEARLVFLTNVDLRDEVLAGRFARDLYHRLTLQVCLPSLADRPEDLAGLVRSICARHPALRGVQVSREAVARLACEPLDGNIRELEAILLRAAHQVAGGPDVVLRQDHIDETLSRFPALPSPEPAPLVEPQLAPRVSFRDPERAQQIRDVLARCGGNQKAAARLLGVPRTTLCYQLQQLGFLKKA